MLLTLLILIAFLCLILLFEFYFVRKETSKTNETIFLCFSLFISLILLILVYFSSELEGRTGIPRIVFPIYSFFVFATLAIFYWSKNSVLDRLKYRFIDVITHRFRTPLSNIRWALDSMKKDSSSAESSGEILQMENANNRLVELVDILVGVNKIDDPYSYAFRAISFREIFENILKDYGTAIKEKNIDLRISPSGNLPLISVDIRRIELVFQILLENAIAYTPEQGVIEIAFTPRQASIIMSVHDTGIGLSKDDMRHLFSDFYRSDKAKSTNTEGLGLGLYIAKKIIDRHHGKLSAQSDGVGKGSTFFLELPILG